MIDMNNINNIEENANSGFKNIGKNNKFNFIKSLVITEKSAMLSDKFGKLSFFVPLDMTKGQLKSLVKSSFGEKLAIKKISTLVVRGKARRFRGIKGKIGDKKKVIITTVSGKVPDLESLI